MDTRHRGDNLHGNDTLERLLAWAWLPVLMAFDWGIFVTQQMIIAENILKGERGDG